MNKVFKTVWNAVRWQLVVVNETTKSHAQSNVSMKSGSEVSLSEPAQMFKKSAIALMLAGVMSTPCVYAADWNVDTSIDTTGSSDITWDNATVTEAGKLTHNEAPDFFLTINGTLTNQGTIEGTGHIKAQSVDNQSTMSLGKLELISTGNGTATFSNSGTATFNDLTLGSASLNNNGTLTVSKTLSFSNAALSNNGVLNLSGTIDSTGDSKLINQKDATITLLNANDSPVLKTNLENYGAIVGNEPVRLDIEKGAVITNKGTLDLSKGAVWIKEKSRLHQSSSTPAQIYALSISEGSVQVDEGTTIKGANFNYLGDSPTSYVHNDGSLEYERIYLSADSHVRGNGSFGQKDASFENYGRDVTIGTIWAKEFENNGVLTVKNLKLEDGRFDRNFDTLTIQNSLTGYLTNYATVDLAESTINKGGSLSTYYDTGVVKGQKVTVHGSLTIEELGETSPGVGTLDITDLTIDNGYFKIADGAQGQVTNLTTKNQARANVNNGATLKVGTLVTGNGSTFENVADSRLEVESANLSGKFVNSYRSVANIQNLTMNNGSLFVLDSNYEPLDAPDNVVTVGYLDANEAKIEIKTNSQLHIKEMGVVEQSHILVDDGGELIIDNGWFNNSTLELVNGSFDRRGKTLGIGNRYVLSDSKASSLQPGQLPENWESNRQISFVDTLTAENTFELRYGAVLKPEKVDLTVGKANGDTVIFNGGTLVTSLDQYFTDLDVKGLEWEAVTSDDRVVVEGLGDLGVAQVGDVKQSIVEHMGGTGHLVFTDNSISLEAVDNIVTKIRKAYENKEGSNSWSLHFTGKFDKVFTVDVANSVVGKLPEQKLIFDQSTLYVLNPDNPDVKKTLYVGGVVGENGSLINGNIGFANVVGASDLVIQGGKEFALMGGKSDQILDGEHTTITVNGDGSKFVLGSIAHSSRDWTDDYYYDKGKVSNLTLQDGGTAHIRNGSFSVSDSLAVKGSGSLIVDKEASFSGKYTGDELTIQNAGSVSLYQQDQDIENVKVTSSGRFNISADKNGAFTLHNSVFKSVDGGSISLGNRNGTVELTGNTLLAVDNLNAPHEFTEADAFNLVAKDQSQIKNTGYFRGYGIVLENGKENAFRDKWYAFENHENGDPIFSDGFVIGHADKQSNIETIYYNAGDTLVEGNVSIKHNGYFINDKTGFFEVLDDLVLADNAVFINHGEADFNKLVPETAITPQATSSNATQSSVLNTGTLNVVFVDVAQGLTLCNEGTLTAKTMLVASGGTLQISGGEISVSGGLDFFGGQINFLGKKKNLVATAGSLMLKDAINGTLTIDDATVSVGAWVTNNKADKQSPVFSGSTLIADIAPLQIGEKGKLAVGTGAKAHAETMTEGSAWFGGDSNFVIDTSKLTQVAVDAEADETTVAALVGSGKLDVAKGAKLHVNKLGLGKYYVTKDFAEELLADGSWADNIVYGEGVNKGLELTQDKDGNVILTVVKKPDPKPPVNPDKPIEPEMIKPMTAIDNIFTEVITSPDLRDPNRNDVVGLVNQAINSAPDDALVSVIDKVSQIGADGGLMTQNFTLASNVIDQVDRHLSYEDVHFNHGVLQTWEGARLWANALGQKVEVSGAEYKGSETSYDGENYGFIMGADLITDNGWRYGAAFGYQKGNMDSMHAVVTTSNKADAFSVTGYAAKQFGQLNVIGSLGYSYIDSDLEQNLPFDMKFKKHTLHSKSDVITAGLKGEMHFKLNDNVAVVPYVGLRAVTVLSDKQTSKLDGHDAFTYDNDTLLQIQTPIGVSVQGLNTSASGWNGRGVFDISMTPVFGDKAIDTTVTGTGSSKTDYVSSVFADKCTGSVRMGYSFEKGALSVGGNLGVTLGDMQKSAVTFGLNGRYAF